MKTVKTLQNYQFQMEKDSIEEDKVKPIAKFYLNRKDIWNEPDRTNPYGFS